MSKNIGTLIRKIRAEEKLTQKEFATKLGVALIQCVDKYCKDAI